MSGPHPDWDRWATTRAEFLLRCGVMSEDALPADDPLKREEPWLWGEQSQLLGDAEMIAEKMAEQIRVHSPDPDLPMVKAATGLLEIAARAMGGVQKLLVEP